MIKTPNLGLTVWNLSTDPYDSGQLASNWQKVEEHDHSPGKGTAVVTAGIADGAVTQAKLAEDISIAATVADDSLIADKFSSMELDRLGLSSTGITRRGVKSIATTETTTSTSYTSLTTADTIASVSIPSNGLIMIAYQALWQNTVTANGRAAIFLDVNQLKTAAASGGTVPVVQEATGNTTINIDTELASFEGGLFGGNSTTNKSEVTTGQIIGASSSAAGFALARVAAGTYDIAVKFKNNAAGTLTVKNRHLYVFTVGG